MKALSDERSLFTFSLSHEFVTDLPTPIPMRATNPGPILDIVDPLTEEIHRRSEELLESSPKSNSSKSRSLNEGWKLFCSTPENGWSSFRSLGSVMSIPASQH